MNGNYSVLCGNIVEMLLHTIGRFDGKSHVGVDSIHSKRFPFGGQVLGSSSPHVSMENMLVATNTANKAISQYCNLTEEIVCVNSIGENLLFRPSGADFDSDTEMLTDNKLLLDAAISLHRNAYTDSTANGTEVWVYTTAGAIDEGAASAVLEQLALLVSRATEVSRRATTMCCGRPPCPPCW